MGLANYYVFQFRGTELSIYDIKSAETAFTVAGNYNFTISPVVYSSIIAAILLSFLFVNCERKLVKADRMSRIKGRICYGASGIIFGFIISVCVKQDKSAFDIFNLSNSISQYGWLYSNVILTQYSRVEKPKIYTEENIKQIIEGIDREEDGKIDQILNPKNIIVIMNESLCDLEVVRQLEVSQDYIPFIKSLENNCIKGNLHVSTFGGGTSVTEYEFLTGNTKHFLPNISSPYVSLNESTEEGLCRILKEQGYYTVAMHPFEGTNWNRNNAYPSMGFDEFLTEEDFKESEKLRHFVSDKGNYQKIIDYYEAYRREDGLFIFNVSMQNHGGYDINNGTVDISVKLEDYDDTLINTYLSLVYESDKAFEYLISYFEEVNEPTMIVMFGDHFPNLPTEFITYLYGGTERKHLSDEENSRMYITPYIIWTNYESHFQEIEDMSANYLGSFLLECAGLELTDYNRFLLNLLEDIPVVGFYGIYDKERNFISYVDVEDGLLESYQALQYLRIKDRKSSLYEIFSLP